MHDSNRDAETQLHFMGEWRCEGYRRIAGSSSRRSQSRRRQKGKESHGLPHTSSFARLREQKQRGDRPWQAAFGGLRSLHHENRRIERLIEAEFEQLGD
jgi:hypothetical protein